MRRYGEEEHRDDGGAGEVPSELDAADRPARLAHERAMDAADAPPPVVGRLGKRCACGALLQWYEMRRHYRHGTCDACLRKEMNR